MIWPIIDISKCSILHFATKSKAQKDTAYNIVVIYTCTHVSKKNSTFIKKMHYSRILEYISLAVNRQNGFTKFIFISKNNLLLIQF